MIQKVIICIAICLGFYYLTASRTDKILELELCKEPKSSQYDYSLYNTFDTVSKSCLDETRSDLLTDDILKEFSLIFNKENAINKFTTVQASISIADDPVEKTEKCLKVNYHKIPGVWSVPQWSAITLNLQDESSHLQWSDYEFINLEVFNPSKTIKTLWLTFFEGGPSRTIELQPGKWQKWEIGLSSFRSEFDFNNIHEIIIFQNQPYEEVTLYIRKLCFIQPSIGWYTDRIDKLIKSPIVFENILSKDKLVLDSTFALIKNKYYLLNTIQNGDINQEDKKCLLLKTQKLYQEISKEEKWFRKTEIANIIESKAVKAISTQVKEPEYGVGIESSMQKVFIQHDEVFKGSFNPEINLKAARNEYESAQVVVFPWKKSLENVRVEISDLSGNNGIKIPAENIIISPVGYVKLQKHLTSCWSKVNAPDIIDWWPDPLLTFLKGINIDKYNAQPFWIRVYIPKNAKPCKYQGNLTVVPGNSHNVKIKFSVDVYPFEIPDRPSLSSVFDADWQWLNYMYIKHKGIPLDSIRGIPGISMNTIPEDIRNCYLNLLLEYKVFPSQIYRQEWSSTDIDFLKGCRNEALLGNYNIMYLNMNHPPQYFDNLLQKIVPDLVREDIYSSAILYGFDEMSGKDFSLQVPYLKSIKTKYPDLKIMITSDADEYGDPFAENSPIKDFIDIWVPQYPLYNMRKANDARNDGKEIWWYICCNPAKPNVMIHSPALEIRALMGADAYRQKTDGFLYWSVLYWPDNNKPIASGPFTSWISNSKTLPPGDGNLIYPGENGPLPTIRLENLRDGLEDYEYYQILDKIVNQLEDKGQVPEEILAEARNILSVKWNPYESPALLYYQREELAEMIIRMKNYLLTE